MLQFSTNFSTGTVMMVNTGQHINAKQQLIIPKAIPSNQGGAMPLFVPITMANNVVLTSQGSIQRQDARFGPPTTLRIQSQVGINKRIKYFFS